MTTDTCNHSSPNGVKNLTKSLRLHGVPNITVEVIITSQQQSARLGECDAGDPADDVVMTVRGQLLVSPDIKQFARGVITSGSKCITIGEKLKYVEVV